MNRGVRATSIAMLVALLAISSFMPASAAALASRFLQPVGEDKITICHALPLEATPYELLIVSNDPEYGGHLAHAGKPVDAANLIWPDIIPAPQDDAGVSYCPSAPPAPPNPEPTTDPADPPVDSPTATIPPAATIPPTVVDPPATTEPATIPAQATEPPGDPVVDDQQEDEPVTAIDSDAPVQADAVGETPAPVTRLPVTGSGASSGSGRPDWLPVGAVLLLFGASWSVIRRRRR